MQTQSDRVTLRKTLYLFIIVINFYFLFILGETFVGGLFTQTSRNFYSSCDTKKKASSSKGFFFWHEYSYVEWGRGRGCCLKNWIKEVNDPATKDWIDCKSKCNSDQACRYIDFDTKTNICYFCSGCAPLLDSVFTRRDPLDTFITMKKVLNDPKIQTSIVGKNLLCSPGFWFEETIPTASGCMSLVLKSAECNANFFALSNEGKCWCVIQKDLNCTIASNRISQEGITLFKVDYPSITVESQSLEEHLESEFESVRGFEYWRTEIDLDLAHKQAVAIFGNLAKFRLIYEKLQRNQCLNVLIVGGSNTDNRYHNHMKKLLWFDWLKRYLNRRFPCHHSHNFVNKAASATGTSWFLNHFEEIIRPKVKTVIHESHGTSDQIDHGIKNWDLVLAEWGVNDKLDERAESDTEMFFQVMYRNQPDHAPLIWALELGIGLGMDDPPCHFSSEIFHRKIYHYYQNPMTSVSSVLYWLMRSKSKYSEEYTCNWKPTAWFTDYFHSSEETHWLGGYLLAKHFSDMYDMYEATHWMGLIDYMPPVWVAQESSINLILSQTLSSISYFYPSAPDESMVFVKDTSWNHTSETSKEKWGLVTKKKYSFIQIDIKGSDFITVEYLETYKSIGNGILWFSSKREGQKQLCKKGLEEEVTFDEDWEEKYNAPVNCEKDRRHWLKAAITRTVSIPKSVAFRNEEKSDVMNICTIPSDLGDKFKLLAIQTKTLQVEK